VNKQGQDVYLIPFHLYQLPFLPNTQQHKDDHSEQNNEEDPINHE